MISNIGEIKQEVLVRLQANTTVAFFTEDMLNGWINQAHRWAASYKKFPFTEKRDKSANTSDSEEEHDYPSDFKTDSIRILTVGGKRLRKTNFDDYLRYKEEQTNGTDRIFADFNRVYYINPNIDITGTIVAYGQYLVDELDTSVPTTTTVFSNSEENGNEAMVQEIMSYAKTRENKLNEAAAHHENAKTILEGIWERVTAEGFGYHPKGEGMWERIDVVDGDYHNELFKRDQF